MSKNMQDPLIKELEELICKGGFFFEFRYGKFDDFSYLIAVETLKKIKFDDPLISKRIISLVWDLPFFMAQLSPLVIERDGRKKKILDACDEVHDILSQRISE